MAECPNGVGYDDNDYNTNYYHKSSTNNNNNDTGCCDCNNNNNDFPIETEEERKIRWTKRWEEYGSKNGEPPRPQFDMLKFTKRRVLQIEYWDRNPETKYQKENHVDLLDSHPSICREEWILNTTLKDCHVALEPNLFPYETPPGVKHYTLWSRTYLTTSEVEAMVNSWLDKSHPNVTAWSFDPSNLSEGMSIDLYHVHVFLYEPPLIQVTFLPEGSSHRVDVPPSPKLQPVMSADVLPLLDKDDVNNEKI
jgi:hypothetical protein